MYVSEVLDPMNTGFRPDLFVDFAEDDRRTVIPDPALKMSEVGNKSIGFNNLTQSVASIQPIYQPDGISGKGCMEYVNNPSLEKMISYNDIPSGPPNFFMQFVWRYIISPVGGYICALVFTVTGNIQYLLTIGSSGILNCQPWVQGIGFIGSFSSVSALNLNQAYIIEISYDQANSLHELKVDGVSEGSSATLISFSVNRMEFTTNHPSVATITPCQWGIPLLYNYIPDAVAIKRNRRYLGNYYDINI